MHESPSQALDLVLNHLDLSLEASIERLFCLMRIPSISTDPAYAPDCRRCADTLVAKLQSFGFDAHLCQTPGHPIVLAHYVSSFPLAPRVLFYGHYDVQPADPLELWENDPFDPKIKTDPDGRKIITGRGASDDKGQLMTFLEACGAWRSVHGTLPCHVTVLIDGEEESGSSSLPAFLRSRASELKANIGLICDSSMYSRSQPAICTSLRGLLSEEITIRTSDCDLHSGEFGGVARNPLSLLSDVLSAIHDDQGRIAIPGFYDAVETPPAEVRQEWAKLSETFDSSSVLQPCSLRPFDNDLSILERLWAFPAADINGISGGYSGAGFKTVIPAQASAKISFRLVANQNPQEIQKAFRKFVRALIPKDCSLSFVSHGHSPAVRFSCNSSFFAAARRALFQEWNQPVALTGCGGSIPIVSDFKDFLGIECLLIGFALTDDRIHSPNEKYDLLSFHKGQRSWARILEAISTCRNFS